MARVGSGAADDYSKEAAALDAAMRARKGTAAAEVELTGALDKSSGALERNAQASRLWSKARQEADDLAQRSAKVHIEDARAIDVETEAVRRNASARASAAALQRGALRGAQDPLFAKAYGLADPVTGISQPQLRQQLQVGSQRAAALQAAVTGGFRPGDPGGLQGPITARQNAELAYADAQRRATRARTDADKLAAESDKQVAKANIDAARAAELKAEADKQAALDERARQSRLPVPRTQAVAGPDVGAQTGRNFPGETTGFYGTAPAATTPGPQFVARQPIEERNPGGSVGFGGGSTWVTTARTAAEKERNAAMEKQAALDKRIAENEVVLNEQRSRSTALETELAAATSRTGASYGAASQQMLRHGALSSEFIQAAVKGQASIKEMGQQALITAGKFGAWTLAATAVYGVVRGIGTLGQGAIEGQSGAQQLHRVINNVDNRRAGEQFNQLSGQFNVPIKDSADAVYRMGQVFHNQGDAVEAAKASLYSYQTGEVDVATSTKNLIAIQRAFGFSSKDLLGIYDQINQAQNTFGISIGDTEAGLAKAGGTFRNAGGDLDYLLGMFVAISKATGRSGQEIGTGIARAANQIRKPASQAALRAQGVDVDPNNLQLTMQRAITAARKPGADYNAIAAGVFGNQYARLFAPILRDPSGLQSALKLTAPGVSAGSAEKELNKRRQQIDYQIKEIGVNMQRIGEALGRSGALNGIGYMVGGLNDVLKVANSILGVFDKLPSGLRTTLLILGEMAIIMKTMRRFGVTDAIGASLGFQGSKDRQLARGLGRSLDSGLQAAKDQYETASRQSVAATTNARRMHDRAVAMDEEFQGRVANKELAPGTPAYEKAQREVSKAYAAQDRAVLRGAELELQVNELREQVLMSERHIANMKKVEEEAGAAGQVEYARQNNLHALDKEGNVIGPNGQRLAPTEAEAARAAEEDARAQADAIAAARAPGGAGRPLNRLEQSFKNGADRVRTLGTDAESVLNRGGTLNAVSNAAANTMERTAGMLTNAGRGLKAFGSTIGSMVAGFGILDIALVAFVGLEALGSVMRNYQAKEQKQLASLAAPPAGSPGSFQWQAQLKQRQKLAGANVDTLGLSAKTAAEIVNPRDWIPMLKGDYQLPGTRFADAQSQAHADALAMAADARTNARRAGTDQPLVDLRLGDITKEMASDYGDLKIGIISVKEMKKKLHKYQAEASQAANADDEGARNRTEAMRQDISRAVGAQRGAAGFDQRYKGLDVKGLQSELEASSQLLASGDGPIHLKEITYLYSKIQNKLAGDKTAAALTEMLKARQAFYQGIEGNIDRQLQMSLGTAVTESDYNAAYAKAMGMTNTLVTTQKSKLARDQRYRGNTTANLVGDQAALAAAQIHNTINPIAVPGLPGGPIDLGPLKQAIKDDNTRLATLNARVKGDRQAIHDAEQERKIDKLKYRDQAYASRQQGRQIDLGYLQSQTQDPTKQAAEAISSARSDVADAARTYGVGSRQWRQAMTTLNNAKHQRDQTIVDSTAAEDQLMQAAVALTGDSVDIANAALKAARDALAADIAAHAGINKIRQDKAVIDQAIVGSRQASGAATEALVQGNNAIRSAYATADPSGEASLRAEVQNANDSYNAVLHNPSLHGRDRTAALRNANAARISANIALKNYYIQQAETMRQLNYQLKEANTDDPVAKARIAYYASLEAIKSAQTPQAKEQAKIDAKTNLRAWRDAKLQSKEDDIDFELQMGKIDNDVAIQRYQALLKMHNLTKAQKREIQLKMKQLKDDAANAANGFDLDVGSIKLPTIYDVRRAIGTIKGGMSQGTKATVNSNVTVNVTVNDPKAAPKVYEGIHQGLGISLGSGMQQAGLTGI